MNDTPILILSAQLRVYNDWLIENPNASEGVRKEVEAKAKQFLDAIHLLSNNP